MNKKDKKILAKILRRRFDCKDCYEPEARNIIDMASKLELDKDYIRQLVEDFNEYFKS